MQTRNRLLDDLAKLATNAAGLAQGVRDEAETAIKAQLERLMGEMDVVNREDFDAMAELARKTAERNAELEARLARLEDAFAKLPHHLRHPAQSGTDGDPGGP
ncbi:MAG: accessory factor UbiK family protein [Alphaproteobacteria bacterium]|nr:accessory factor UbiK family protein [Alphaproteobacteria bacterium]MDX5370321.1 accessory factor UbiK family protein [Alphaproteobacteria bacterium]MDX5464857.1 accessory factor UbiK family protein [Alphaproteobacteria bacterium]